MAKVQITITDVEDQEGAVHMDYTFDPELPKAQEGSDKIPLTPAQTMAMNIYYFLQKLTGEFDTEETSGDSGNQEVGCEETSQEATCCGGACHND